jgi:hypothetical protein
MTNFPDDDDGAVLESLHEAGVDLSKPLEIDFQLAVLDEASGQKIADAIRAAGYPADLVYDDGGVEDGVADVGDQAHEDEDQDEDDGCDEPSWTIYVIMEIVPDYQRVVDIQAKLDELAKPFGGEVDGWGAMI